MSTSVAFLTTCPLYRNRIPFPLIVSKAYFTFASGGQIREHLRTFGKRWLWLSRWYGSELTTLLLFPVLASNFGVSWCTWLRVDGFRCLGCPAGDDGDVGNGRVQELVHGDEVEEGAPVHRVQDRREVEAGDRGQGRRSRGRLRRPGQVAAHRRLPLRRVRLRLRHRGQLPQEQDLLHRMVRPLFKLPAHTTLRLYIYTSVRLFSSYIGPINHPEIQIFCIPMQIE